MREKPLSHLLSEVTGPVDRQERTLGALLRLALLGLGLILALLSGADRIWWLAVLPSYAGLGLILWGLARLEWLSEHWGRALAFFGMLLDVLFVSWLIFMDGGLGSPLFLLYVPLLLKAILHFAQAGESLLGYLLFAPAYVVALFAAAGSFYFLRLASFWIPYGVLCVLAGLGLYAAGMWRGQTERIQQLSNQLGYKSSDLERKTVVLQGTAADLGERVVQLRSLQEGIRAISSALALEDVLRLIVENASQVLGGVPCYLALIEDGHIGRPVRAQPAWESGTVEPAGLEGVAEGVARQGQPVSISQADDASTDSPGASTRLAIIGTPLLVDDRPIGALVAAASGSRPFDPEQLGLLTAFADQAAVAVKNARLYRDLAQEKRRTEEKSYELEAIVRGIGDGVIVTDRARGLLLINPRAVRIFGLTAAPVVGRPIEQVVPHEALLGLLNDTLNAPEGVAVREIALPAQRERQPVYQGLAATLRDPDGQPTGIVTVLRDITGQKELERMKTNFLSVISHELKTPLHSIKGFVEIILMGKTGAINDIQRDFLSTVREQTAQLQRLINDLLEFSRLESGQIRLHPQTIEPANLAREVVEKLAPLAEEARVTLLSDLPADFQCIEADPVRMEQVLSNLADNAIKFTPAGGQVRLAGIDLGERVRLMVSDTGIGIPEEEREKVFDRFYQIDSGSTRSYRGTGLGLTICKHIVEQHQGRIWVEGAEGQGAIFVMELPKRLPAEEDLAIDFSALAAPRERRPE